jgi:hypothetical protein
MKIVYRIQHAAGRDEGLKRLLPLLPKGAEVVTDHESANPIPMRGYLACLEGAPRDATHVCIVQDDAVPCREIGKRVREAVAERPDDVLSLFVGGLSGRTRKDFWAAQGAGERWAPIYFREIHHVVALVWPIGEIDDFLTWYPDAKIPIPVPHKSDDAVVGYWARTRRKLFWATVPCLVQHPDDLPSIVQGARTLGDKGRKAIAFIDDLG